MSRSSRGTHSINRNNFTPLCLFPSRLFYQTVSKVLFQGQGLPPKGKSKVMEKCVTLSLLIFYRLTNATFDNLVEENQRKSNQNPSDPGHFFLALWLWSDRLARRSRPPFPFHPRRRVPAHQKALTRLQESDRSYYDFTIQPD